MQKLEQLKTFEDACQVLELDPEKVIPDFSWYPEEDKASMEAHAKLVIIAKAANLLANDGTDWTTDWDNDDEWKYYPLFDMEGGSSGFRFYAHGRSASVVGSRLCFVSREAARYVGERFIDLYKAYFVI